MLSVYIRIDESEYRNLQSYTDYYLRWCYAHFNVSKSMNIEAEPLVGLLYESKFKKHAELLKFPKSGKLISFTYPEAKALYSLMALEGSIGMINIRGKLDKALTDWKPSYTAKSFRSWYDQDEDAAYLRDTFGEYEELDDVTLEISVEQFNKREKL